MRESLSFLVPSSSFGETREVKGGLGSMNGWLRD